MNDTFLPGSGFDTYETQDKVLIGLRGVGSCTAVRILQQQGFGVVGAAVRLTSADREAADAARQLAERLGIECITLNAEELAEQQPADALFSALLSAADRLGVQYIATGHYARVELDTDGASRICPPETPAADQGAALLGLPQELLGRLLLPLGEFESADLAEMAQELGL